MAPLVAAFDKRETTQLDFCREHGVALPTLRAWRAKLAGQPTRVPGFVEVGSWPSTEGGDVRLEIPGVGVLRIAAGTDTLWVAHLLRDLSCSG